MCGDREKRRIFRPKRDEVGDCREIHEEALHDLCFSPDTMKIRGVMWEGHVACMGGKMSACIVL